MKRITSFKATGLNEYIDIDLDFYKDMTLVYGMNGSGKTSALRLMVSVIDGCFNALLSIPYKSAEVTGLASDNSRIKIFTNKSDDSFSINVNIGQKSEHWTTEIPRFFDNEGAKEIEQMFRRSETFDLLERIESPVFLDVNRRFERFPTAKDFRHNNRDLRMRRISMHRRHSLSKNIKSDEALLIALFLVDDAIEKGRFMEARLNDQFREKILLKSFEYASSPPKVSEDLSIELPNALKLDERKPRIMKMLDSIESNKRGKLHRQITQLFDTLYSSEEELKRVVFRSKSKKDLGFSSQAVLNAILIQDRINLLDSIYDTAMEYEHESMGNKKSINQFFELINRFFNPIKKHIEIDNNGDPLVTFKDKIIPYGLLSSGERQILIIMAHLKFNEYLENGGVFIIDEPELSLHVSWQEILIDSMVQANPDIQFIFATHAPSIVAGRTERCRSLGR